MTDKKDVKEDHPLVPLTLYNKYKGLCEPLLKKNTDNNFEGGFASKLMHKDLSLAISAARNSKTKVDFTKQAYEIFSEIIKGF